MNKKLFYGATAISVVAIGGYLYYRHHRDSTIDKFLELFREDDTPDETLDAPEEGAWNAADCECERWRDGTTVCPVHGTHKEEPVHG